MTSQWLDQKEAPKNFPKPNVPKKGRGHCLVVCCWSDPLQLSESWQNHYIWQVFSSNRWDALKTASPAANIGQQKSPILLHYNARLHVTLPAFQKLNRLDHKVLHHQQYSPDLLPTDYHFFKHLDNFFQEKCFHEQQETENGFQEFVKSWSKDFYDTGINKLISCWQKCVDCSSIYFD